MAKLKPVSIAGIEFDALISEDKTYQQEIPDYPTEEGFSVSDTIILKPITLNMVLFIANTPVTWSKKHGISMGRITSVTKKIEQLYFARKLVKVVTPDSIYTNMGIVSLQISKSKEFGNTRQVSVSLKKVYITKRKTVTIPKYILKSGKTAANAGKAETSKTSKTSSESGVSTATTSSSVSANSNSKKSQSILYGAANKFGFL